jgi:hypothetical protein
MDMGGKSCWFIGQPSQLVHSFDSSYHPLVVERLKSMNLMMFMMVLMVVVVVVVVREMEDKEDGREGRRWRGKRGSKHYAQGCHVWLGKAAGNVFRRTCAPWARLVMEPACQLLHRILGCRWTVSEV